MQQVDDAYYDVWRESPETIDCLSDENPALVYSTRSTVHVALPQKQDQLRNPPASSYQLDHLCPEQDHIRLVKWIQPSVIAVAYASGLLQCFDLPRGSLCFSQVGVHE